MESRRIAHSFALEHYDAATGSGDDGSRMYTLRPIKVKRDVCVAL